MKLTSLQSITDFMTCAGKNPAGQYPSLGQKKPGSGQIPMRFHQEERRHAQRALSIMMNIQWKNNYFEAIDPDEARRILDEELIRNGACETAYHRDHYPDQPYSYTACLRYFF